MGYTFPKKLLSFRRFSILKENCSADIINVAFKYKTFVVKCCKNCFRVSYTFLQKPNDFKFLSILEENCVADINNETITVFSNTTNPPLVVVGVRLTFLRKVGGFGGRSPPENVEFFTWFSNGKM